MLSLLAAALAGGALAAAVQALLHRALLRGLRAPREPHRGPGPTGLGIAPQRVQAVVIPGPQGQQLFAWWVQRAPGPLPATGATVLVMHGWGANAEHMLPALPPLHEAGFGVLMLEARCHGRSSDAAYTSLPRFAEDIAAGLAWLRGPGGVDGHRIALLGHSVGAAAALLHAARVHDVCGVVSLAAFAHPQELMRRFLAQHRVPYPVLGWWVVRHVQQVIGARFDDIAALRSVQHLRCPLLLVHGRDDRTVPFADAQRLLAAAAGRPAPEPATLLPVSGDHDLRDALALHAPAVVAFLQACCAHPAQRGPGCKPDNPAPCSP